MQTFPLRILYHPSTYYMDYSPSDHTKNITAKLWTPHRRSNLDMFDVCSLLAVVGGAFGVNVKTSNIQHDRVRCKVCSGRPFGAEKIVGYFYLTLVYSKLTTQKQVRKQYGDGIASVTVDNFSS